MFDTPSIYIITKIIKENNFVKTFWLKSKNNINFTIPKSGQYIMLWLPDLASEDKKINKRSFTILDQIPMSISDIDNENIAITVKNLGLTTNELHNYETGRYVGVTGPLGNSFTVFGKKLLVIAGGMGIAPLHLLVKTIDKKNVKIDLLFGVKNTSELLFINKIKKYCNSVHIVTDDGSYGSKGVVTESIPDVYDGHDQIFSCGPERMMKIVMDFAVQNNVNAQFSLERFMHCGIGVCGFCSIDGLLVCKDGPIFDSSTLKDIKEFGRIKRMCNGSKKEI